MLQTQREIIDVHLGPEWYINQQDSEIHRGDQIAVTGARILFGDASALMATEIVKGEDVLQMRGIEGDPVWIAWRKKDQ